MVELDWWFLGASAGTPGDNIVTRELDIRKGFLGSIQPELSLGGRVKDSEKEVRYSNQYQQRVSLE